MAKKILEIRDGLDDKTHEFRGVEAEIIQTGEFQRLNYVNNLGMGYLVYPNAHLKRFSHCIGSSAIAKDFAGHLGIGEKETGLLSIALLLHDLGHGPFSHATEMGGMDHEERTSGLILGNLKMPRAYCGDIPCILESRGVSAQDIASTLEGNYKLRIVNQLVSGFFDLDKGDYLRRDAYATGAKIGTIDIRRLMSVMKNIDGELCLLEKGIDDFIHFVDARKYMYRNVYNHKRISLFEEMLKAAIKRSGMTPEEIWHLGDGELLSALHSRNKEAREIADIIYANVPYEKALVIYSDGDESLESARNLEIAEGLESRLAKHAGIPEHHVIASFKFQRQKGEHFPIMLSSGEKCNVFEYSAKAMAALKYPESKFYAIVAVHPSASNGQKKKIAGMAEAMSKAV